MDSPFISFVLLGKVGALEVGIHRADVVKRLGRPEAWLGKPPCIGPCVRLPDEAEVWYFYDEAAGIKFDANGVSTLINITPENINNDRYPFDTWPIGPDSTIGDFIQFLAQNGIPFYEEPDDEFASYDILAGERCYAAALPFHAGRRLPQRDRPILLISFESESEKPRKRGGPEFFGWGKGAEITKPLSAFTRQTLEAAGWTKEKLLEMASAYRDIAALTPENVAAPVRAHRLEALAGLFN